MENRDTLTTGRCPRCGSDDVRSGAGIAARDKIALHTGEGAFGPLRKLDQYVCLGCGCVETYLRDPAGLAYIAGHWPRVAAD